MFTTLLAIISPFEALPVFSSFFSLETLPIGAGRSERLGQNKRRNCIHPTSILTRSHCNHLGMTSTVYR
jgi:hypothetical protein